MKEKLREKRKRRVRANIFGTKERPRLSVFRSNRHIYAQLIDDQKGETFVSFSDLKLTKKTDLTKIEIAKQVGQNLASEASKKKIKKVIFDRGGYKYHGQVKALAEGAREKGLKF